MLTGAKRGKTCQLVPSAGKHANWYQARENMSAGTKRWKTCKPVPSAGKYVNWCQARENMSADTKRGETCKPVPSAGKYANWCQARENACVNGAPVNRSLSAFDRFFFYLVRPCVHTYTNENAPKTEIFKTAAQSGSLKWEIYRLNVDSQNE